jgi:hypothetical protein
MKPKEENRMRIRERLWVGLLTLVLAQTAVGSVFAQETSPPDRTRNFKLGTDIGFSGGTIDGTAFAVGINGDYEVAPHVSIGPLIQLGLTNHLFQIGVSAQAKLTLDIPDVPELKPQLQAGIGFIHADLDIAGGTPDDTSWLIPIGMGLEYRAARNLYFDTTLLFNITDLNILNQSDDLHVTWFVGLRFLL